MSNNIGITTESLPRVIGQTIDFDTTGEWNSITMISGQLDLGAIIFDENGTMGVCSNFSRDDNNNLDIILQNHKKLQKQFHQFYCHTYLHLVLLL